MRILASALLVLAATWLQAQNTFPNNGVAEPAFDLHAFINADIVPRAGDRMEDATLVIRDGRIETIGKNAVVPEGAIVHDCEGLTIYPSFIDIYTNYGVAPAKEKENEDGEQHLSNRDGAYAWNEALNSDFRAAEHFKHDGKQAEAMREAGFGTVLTHRSDGISQGSGSLVLLSDQNEHELVLKADAAAFLSFRKGVSTQDNPSSLMGAIALIRQTYYDGQWYKNQDEEFNLSLEAWNNLQSLPQIFSVESQLEILRAQKIGDEFGIKYIIKSDGTEYRRLNAVKESGSTLIVGLNFPTAYDVKDPLDAEMVSMQRLKHWELAPANAALLAEQDIPFVLTSNGLESPKSFLTHVRKAMEYGLSEEDVLAALTTIPAQLLQAESEVGSLVSGKRANFLLCNGSPFSEDGRIVENWVNGSAHVLENTNVRDLSGQYLIRHANRAYRMEIQGEAGSHEVQVYSDTTLIDGAKSNLDGDLLTLFIPDSLGDLRISGWHFEDRFSGRAQDEAGNWFEWTARAQALEEDEADEAAAEEAEENENESVDVWYPFQAYGWTDAPQQERVLFKNATVWSNTENGIMEATDVLIDQGKILEVGKNLEDKKARVVDASNMHLTSGVIDEHSHIAISRGVNEGTQASSAEVRIGDVVNSEDVNIYRQLAGGVTAAQLLHGSANPIGGQSAIIKMRWGSLPEEMKIDGADGFIKFALGENVKQTNWGDFYRSRFPQTRMGVEQVYMDHFSRAQAYGEQLKDPNSGVRRDIELDALLEIVNSERFITCHSYVQSEINMLMKVAEHFDFRINTFTHILEGYKVADKMAEHGAGGSTFSDWWAYKYEVIDAIPYNAALMTRMGVVTAINSDDAEMARRLNQEAAKTIQYGGLSQEEAWKTVTLNPAILLHLDDRMGSVESGKDADIVLWTQNPLSVYAQVDQTWVDGKMLFSRETDKELRAQNTKERARIIAKMIEHENNGGKTQPVVAEWEIHYHCSDREDECAGH
jgi:imidazolonepropionase-like amidohydrolase